MNQINFCSIACRALRLARTSAILTLSGGIFRSLAISLPLFFKTYFALSRYCVFLSRSSQTRAKRYRSSCARIWSSGMGAGSAGPSWSPHRISFSPDGENPFAILREEMGFSA